jgi:flagellar motor switch/type III secretory pathway protein FliN
MERTQSMSEGKRIETRSEGTDPVELAGDAPVEVCLELARFTLPLQELARLAVGDVLQAGCAVGAPITLRAGGKALARGELVVVDDEVGVRVTELLDGQPAD